MTNSLLLSTPSEVGNQTEPPASEETAELTSLPEPGSRNANTTSDSHSQGTNTVAESVASHVPLHTNCNLLAFQHNAILLPVNTSTPEAHPSITTHRASPSADLRVQTDLWNSKNYKGIASGPTKNASEIHPLHTPPSTGLPVRTSSVRSALSAANYTGGSLSPVSAVSSPGLGSLADMTPLPSPIGLASPPGAWKTMANSSSTSIPGADSRGIVIDQQHESPSHGRGTPKKRKAYQGLISTPPGAPTMDPQTVETNATSHSRNRTLSEYVPTSAQVPRTRYNAVSGSQTPMSIEPPIPKSMYREEYLAVQRGISALQPPRPPTPPPSNRSGTGSSDLESPSTSPRPNTGALPLRYEARDVKTGALKSWSAIRQLGKGTFSTVMLASSEDKYDANHILKTEEELNPKALVAVKICEHGPAGGADEKKIESSLKRELDILKSIHHPSLVHLKAVSILETRAFLVLNYSAGGDLFELASLQLDLLVPSLIRRIFAELVAAVRYLHLQYIVHRDIKLENVLVNVRTATIPTILNWQTHPTSVVTLTDLGLGRWIPQPPASPLLNTRCGSEDYAAPELLMGQEYDGRATDAWALGVLLYAIMEGRLPFDPIPGSRRQSPTSHRIARCEWSWMRWANKDGEWDGEKGRELNGAAECVEGLLRRARTRWGLEKVEGTEWVRGGLTVEGGLTRDSVDDDE